MRERETSLERHCRTGRRVLWSNVPPSHDSSTTGQVQVRYVFGDGWKHLKHHQYFTTCAFVNVTRYHLGVFTRNFRLVLSFYETVGNVFALWPVVNAKMTNSHSDNTKGYTPV